MVRHYISPRQRHRIISAQIKIPNAFLQSLSIGLLPVTVLRFWLKKPRRNCVTIKKKDLKSYFLTSGDPRHAPEAKCLLHCILLFITFDLICNMTMFVQNGFWTLWGHTPWPFPEGLHQNSECVPPVLIHRAIACESFEILAYSHELNFTSSSVHTQGPRDPKSELTALSQGHFNVPNQNLCGAINILIWTPFWTELCLCDAAGGLLMATFIFGICKAC